jgi:hypothetical protein
MLFLVSGDVSNAFLLLLAVVGRRHKKKEKVTRGGTVKIRFMRFTTVQTEECLGRSINGSSNILIRTI